MNGESDKKNYKNHKKNVKGTKYKIIDVESLTKQQDGSESDCNSECSTKQSKSKQAIRPKKYIREYVKAKVIKILAAQTGKDQTKKQEEEEQEIVKSKTKQQSQNEKEDLSKTKQVCEQPKTQLSLREQQLLFLSKFK